jgi:hypothetical protein
MDIGGRKMAGFASGASTRSSTSAARWRGGCWEHRREELEHYFYFMAPFGIIGRC